MLHRPAANCCEWTEIPSTQPALQCTVSSVISIAEPAGPTRDSSIGPKTFSDQVAQQLCIAAARWKMLQSTASILMKISLLIVRMPTWPGAAACLDGVQYISPPPSASIGAE